ncbi:MULTISPECIES: hypothetical protein [Prochlorococcus]|nr:MULTISPECIES: hypothetical protein [Prochlorococcus]KGG10952.1 putative protein family PM-12 [Prochlorococcus marinus str. LG]KGG19957.1 putative protein family PM-12 [Prochlorococcus marinus str. SS2]KGG24201.1 putative protein family PM-12 [Prochlorococcus marinus str. SS35]KGG31542.1 putative protein family PM-12 [Prochlorococcus marinus str. SS51]KGG34607.1 putative protein family PM-12 [Prochlorococcus sp. SS52]
MKITFQSKAMATTRTQLNINIEPELMEQLKRVAISSGQTISAFVSETISNKLENDSPKGIESRILSVEQRLKSVEEKCFSSISES